MGSQGVVMIRAMLEEETDSFAQNLIVWAQRSSPDSLQQILQAKNYLLPRSGPIWSSPDLKPSY